MKLFSSLSFRLALVYVVLFSLSLSALIALNYWIAVSRPLAKIEAQVRAEANDLANSYSDDTRSEFLRRIYARDRTDADRKAYVAFFGADGELVSSNLPSVPRKTSEGLARIEADLYVDGDEQDHLALVIDRKLQTGGRLIVGRDIEDIAQHEELLQAAVPWTLGVSVLLGIMGGVVMSFAIGRRLEVVSSTARTVIAGDLSQRVPVRGTGDDFDHLSETINLMLDRIEQSMRAVVRVSDNVAHELRTPLARMQTMLESTRRLQSVGQTAAVRPLLDELSEEGERLQSIFDALLRISRIESGAHQVNFEPFDATTMLTDVVDLYSPAAEDKNIVLRLTHEDLQISGDAELIAQGLCNLIDNAIKYSPENSVIEVRLYRDGVQRPVVSVSDSGSGIDPEWQGQITERFFRGTNVTGTEGYGLGLSLVAAVAAAHHSQLYFVSNAPGLRVIWTF